MGGGSTHHIIIYARLHILFAVALQNNGVLQAHILKTNDVRYHTAITIGCLS
jgi:hypothetical protein